MQNNILTILIIFPLTLLYPNTISISGCIINENNAPITEVNIYTNQIGTSSNANGNFEIIVGSDDSITFTHINYVNMQLLAKDIPDTLIMSSKIIKQNEIIVQADFSNLKISHTPSSITILEHRDLNNKTHFQNIIDLVSNLNYSGGTSRPRYFQIRGIGERSQYTGEGAPNFSVGYIIDGIDFSGVGMAGMLFDIKQIEIFKGPQSLIFGPNAVAGLINITSNEPTPYLTGISEINIGIDQQKVSNFAIGGPLHKKLHFRLAIQKFNQNGFRKNIYRNLDNTNRRDETLSRIKIHWQLTPNLDLQTVNINANINNGYDAWAIDNNENFLTNTDEQGMDSQHSNSNSIKINYNSRKGTTIFYQYTYSIHKLEHSYDGDWANNDYWIKSPYYFDPNNTFWEYSFYDQTIRKQYKKTHEMRMSANKNSNINWDFGTYLSITNESDNASGYLFGGNATSTKTNFEIINNATYIQSDIQIIKFLRIIMNLRSENHYTAYNSDGLNWNDQINNYTEIPQISEEVQHNFSGAKLATIYNINNSTNIFSSITYGYKAGGINQNPYLSNNHRYYNPEFNKNLECGIKFNSINMISNLTLFTMQRINQQVQISSQQIPSNPNSFYYYTSNATEGMNHGFEFDSKVKLIENIIINATLGLLKTRLAPYTFWINDTTSITLGKREQAMAPKYNFAFSFDYNHPYGILTKIEFTRKGEYYLSESHDKKSSAYQLLNMNITYSTDLWSFSFWCNNMLNERYPTRGFYFGNEPIWNEQTQNHEYPDKLYLSYGDPIQYGLSIKHHF